MRIKRAGMLAGIVALATVAGFAAATSASASSGAGSTITWNGASDTAVAANIAATASARDNASGMKITSNANSADYPGIYFIWDSKQKDAGYLKVDASIFSSYDSFTLTAKESNAYWDFTIALQPGQVETNDNCYVFYIPKVGTDAKNINMVFISNWAEKANSVAVNVGFIEG